MGQPRVAAAAVGLQMADNSKSDLSIGQGWPTAMGQPAIRFPFLAAKTMVSHTVTYFLMGALAYHFFHYAAMMNRPGSGLHATTSIWVALGPALQPIRGMVFALVFYPLRGILFGRKNGWLLMSWLLVGLGILGTFGAPGGSLEGLIYTTTPVLLQLRGLLEVVPQAFLLSALLCYWVNHPGRKWMNWSLGVVFIIVIALPILGLLARHPA